MHKTIKLVLCIVAGSLSYLIGAVLGLFSYLGNLVMFPISPIGAALVFLMMPVLYISLRKRVYIVLGVSMIALFVGYLTSGWLIDAFVHVMLSELQ